MLLIECQSVHKAAGVVERGIDQQFGPHQFIDAPLPPEEQLPETAEATAGGHFAGVRNGHDGGGWVTQTRVDDSSLSWYIHTKGLRHQLGRTPTSYRCTKIGI